MIKMMILAPRRAGMTHEEFRTYVTEAWFESVEAQKQNMRWPRYMEILRPDEHRFADGERAVMHYTREMIVADGARNTVRVFYFRRRRPGLTRGEFQERWLEGMAEALAGIGRAHRV